MKYEAYKDLERDRVGDLMHRCGVFWAFSNKQFEENRTPLEEGDKYVSIGAGGYLPKSKLQEFQSGMDAISDWTTEAAQQLDAEDAILHELGNYECFYTGDIEPAMQVLEDMGYSRNQVSKVYRAYAGSYA